MAQKATAQERAQIEVCNRIVGYLDSGGNEEAAEEVEHYLETHVKDD